MLRNYSQVLWTKKLISYKDKIGIRLMIDLRDIWIGAFWRNDDITFQLYFCFIPCLALVAVYKKNRKSINYG